MTDFEETTQDIRGGKHIALHRAGTAASARDVIDAWIHNASFRSFFTDLLKSAPYEAFFWETPPITRETVERDFEFVVIESSSLAAIHPNPSAFKEHFTPDATKLGVASFWNLGRDSLLVAPTPSDPDSDFGHLASFLRAAEEEQTHALWRAVGEAVESRLSAKPVWVSTAGLGVDWLHVRLDSRPK
ncbi:MAG: hypothetical protein AAF517_16350, partial [Planctomycetota bacterium]